MKFALYSAPRGTRSQAELIDLSAAMGLDSLEIFSSMEFARPDFDEARRIRRYADERGVSICCFSVYIDVTGDDRREQLDRLRAYAHVAQILGSPYLHHTLCSDFKHPQRIAEGREVFFARAVEGAREIYDYAASLGVRAVYEDQGFLINGIDGFDAFLRAVERPVGVVADFGNIRQANEEIVEFIHRFAPHVVHAHLKDSVILPATTDQPYHYPTLAGSLIRETAPFAGTVPLAEGIDALRRCGFDGVCSLEYGTADPALIARTRALVEG